MTSNSGFSIPLGPMRSNAIRAVPLCVCLLAVCSYGYPVELIRNGSFENNRFTGFTDAQDWDDGLGIDNDIGFVARDYAADCGGEWCSSFGVDYVTPGPPSSGVSGPAGRGGYFAGNFGFVNSAGSPSGSAAQFIDLRAFAGHRYTFSAWFASAIDERDYATVTLEFFSGMDATGESLGSIEFNGDDQQTPFIVGSANEKGFADSTVPPTQDNWTLYRGAGRIPSTSGSAAVVLFDNSVLGSSGGNGYVDLVSLLVVSEPPSLPGDYNGNSAVEQGDLDLVLLHWGGESIVAPVGWIRDLPMGPVDQAELDGVLLNWGNTQPPVNGAGTVPEPASVVLSVGLVPLAILLLRPPAWSTRAISLTTRWQLRKQVAAERMASIQVETKVRK